MDCIGWLKQSIIPTPRFGVAPKLQFKGDLMTAATKDFAVSRVFDAPRDLVWKAWTEADRLKEWFGPKGVTIPTVLAKAQTKK